MDVDIEKLLAQRKFTLIGNVAVSGLDKSVNLLAGFGHR